MLAQALQAYELAQAISIFRQHDGVLRTSRAMRLGIAPRILYALRDSGQIVEMTRGIYRLADAPLPGNQVIKKVLSRAAMWKHFCNMHAWTAWNGSSAPIWRR